VRDILARPRYFRVARRAAPLVVETCALAQGLQPQGAA